MILAFIAIVCGVCGLFAFVGWLVERSKPDAISRYQVRWPRTQGFRGY